MFLVIVFAVGFTFLLWKGVESIISYRARFNAYDAIILTASRRNGIDPALVKAVIWRESRFQPGARGKAGEIGLMQIMPDQSVVDWAKRNNRAVPSKGALVSPELNIEIGSWYLSKALRRWSRYRDALELALCEYNAGPARALSWRPLDPNGDVRSRITISSTLNYVNAITAKYEEYKREKFGRNLPQPKRKKKK